MSILYKYNPLWLEANNFDENWHENQTKYLQSAIDNATTSVLIMIIQSADTLEAFSSVLFKYSFKITDTDTHGYKLLEIRIK